MMTRKTSMLIIKPDAVYERRIKFHIMPIIFHKPFFKSNVNITKPKPIKTKSYEKNRITNVSSSGSRLMRLRTGTEQE